MMLLSLNFCLHFFFSAQRAMTQDDDSDIQISIQMYYSTGLICGLCAAFSISIGGSTSGYFFL